MPWPTTLARACLVLFLLHAGPAQTQVTLHKKAPEIADKFLSRADEYAKIMRKEGHSAGYFPLYVLGYYRAALDVKPDDPEWVLKVVNRIQKLHYKAALDTLADYLTEYQSGLAGSTRKKLFAKLMELRKIDPARYDKPTYLTIMNHGKADMSAEAMSAVRMPVPKITVPFANLVLEFDLPDKRRAAALTDKVLREYKGMVQSFDDEEKQRAREEADFANEVFFKRQTGNNPFQGSDQDFLWLEASMRAGAAKLLEKSGFDRKSALEKARKQIFIFASVHGPRSLLVRHTHEEASVVGVFYSKVPNGSSNLSFIDPRGVSSFASPEEPPHDQVLPLPYFHRRVDVSLREGLLVVFPGWLCHEVVANHLEANDYRVSLSFNLHGSWQDTSSTVVRPEAREQRLPGDQKKAALAHGGDL